MVKLQGIIKKIYLFIARLSLICILFRWNTEKSTHPKWRLFARPVSSKWTKRWSCTTTIQKTLTRKVTANCPIWQVIRFVVDEILNCSNIVYIFIFLKSHEEKQQLLGIQMPQLQTRSIDDRVEMPLDRQAPSSVIITPIYSNNISHFLETN